MADYFLGVDSSTQSVSVTVIEEVENAGKKSSRIVYENSINFDPAFPGYGTKNGVLPADPSSGNAFTPPQLWIEALQAAFEKMQGDGVDLSSVKCIGVSGQQHGSVYLNSSAPDVLAGLTAEKNLAEQTAGIYTRDVSPIWMDASTNQECREITKTLGGDDNVCRLTGSRCFERFTGPQIRKFFKTEPDAYSETAHIALVSSFVPSLLAGKLVPIDPGDGAGMNLMDITSRQWSREALEATAPGLNDRLLPILPSDSVVGSISPFFVHKFGMDADCKVIPGTGDNPASLIGLGLVSSGTIGISLGTSDTLFAFMTQPATDPTGQSHVFGSPTGDYMALFCYMNGSLAREAVKDRFSLSWDQFSEYLTEGPGNGDKVMLPYFGTEIIPKVLKPGVRKYGIDENSPGENVRAVVMAQMTSMAMHAEWMKDIPRQIYATGGASANRAILQIMADVFDAEVTRQETTNAAGLGAAIRAQHAWSKAVSNPVSWEDLVSGYLNTAEENIIRPVSENVEKLKAFREVYRKRESEYLKSIA
jgi:xylulokinase